MNRYELPEDQRLLIEGMLQPCAVCQVLDREVILLAVSGGLCELFGYQDPAQALSDMNRNRFQNVHPGDAAGVANAVLRFGSDSSGLDVVFRAKKKDAAGYRVIRLMGRLRDADGGVRLGQVWFTDEGDYTEETGTDLNRGFSRAVRDESHENADRYDSLTGLPNMTGFLENAGIGREALLQQGGLPALLYIDLSGMKSYNHQFGFSEGDKLLQYFARLLSRFFQARYCSHINADRFAVFADENGLEEKLARLFREWRGMETKAHLPVCVGIYSNRMEDVPAGMAFDRAKIACDAIKGTHASAFNYYSDELNEEIARQQYILENFDRALSENWIRVYYQPIVRTINGKVCDEEALARWIDPAGIVLRPSEFIPHLESAGLVYRLDLYVLERVLEHIRIEAANGFHIVPHSINLSRSDFDACDMVEEIRRRVDAAGVRRHRISIEITESVIGSDFDFIKTQVDRFQALGFPVWLDDFGNGYSSLDVLQSIRVSLLKFDMSFMQKLDENDKGRIILTELMKMASALGVDTICEGVETEKQARFLQEIGCSKLQGFLFSRPTPFEAVLENHRQCREAEYEDPEESAYFQSICGLNLYDIGMVAREEKTSLKNAYTTLPMCVIEIKGDSTRFVRTNQSYRDFFMRFYGIDPSTIGQDFVRYGTAFMHSVVKTCCGQGARAFYDEKMPDGSIVHAFARRIDTNPVTGITAVAIAVLSVREPGEKLLVEQILSVIEQFGEYMPGGFLIYRAEKNQEKVLYANRAVFEIFGCDGAEDFRALTGGTFQGMVHPDDYGRISSSIRDQIRQSEADLDFVEYRIIRRDGEIRWIDDYGHYIEYDDQNSLFYVFISDITEKHEQAESDKALHTAVVEALTKAYDSVWLITDVETEKFELFRVDREMEHLMPANIAAKIERFTQALAFYSRLVAEEDRQRFLLATSPERIVRNTERRPIYAVPFRRIFEDGMRHYRMEFTRVDLPGGKTGIVAGFRNVDSEILREENIRHSIIRRDAIIDALTRPYDSAFIITDLKTERFELCRVDRDSVHFIPAREAMTLRKYTDAFASYSRLVLEEDRERFLNAVTPEKIARNTESRELYSVPFRRVFENGIRSYQVEFARIDLDSGEVHYIAGFRDVDGEARREKAEAPHES